MIFTRMKQNLSILLWFMYMTKMGAVDRINQMVENYKLNLKSEVVEKKFSFILQMWPL